MISHKCVPVQWADTAFLLHILELQKCVSKGYVIVYICAHMLYMNANTNFCKKVVVETKFEIAIWWT